MPHGVHTDRMAYRPLRGDKLKVGITHKSEMHNSVILGHDLNRGRFNYGFENRGLCRMVESLNVFKNEIRSVFSVAVNGILFTSKGSRVGLFCIPLA